MGLQKKIFVYVGAGLVALMILLTWIFLQTINQATDMVRQERLALVENIAALVVAADSAAEAGQIIGDAIVEALDELAEAAEAHFA